MSKESQIRDLQILRDEIDRVDEQLVGLLNDRAQLSLRVKGAKEHSNLASYMPAREREVLERVLKLAGNGPFPKDALIRIFGNILSSSRFLQGEQIVSYLGPKGSSAFDAALQKFGRNANLQPDTSIKDIFEKVDSGLAHYGVVPLETSAGGLVNETLNAFLYSPARIISEVTKRSNLLLLAHRSGLDQIQRVFCDSCSVAMAERWMSINLPGVTIEVVASADLAAKRATESERSAALGTENVAETYHLTCIARGIEEDCGSARYVVIGDTLVSSSGRDKTSLLCAVADKPGALLLILEPFARGGITLTKIESRVLSGNYVPSGQLTAQGGDYFFFVDLLGHQDDASVAKALRDLSAVCLGVHILGSYPVDPI